MEIIMATWNPGKVEWLMQGLTGLNVQVRSLRDGEVPEADETGETFEANALLKARSFGALADAIIVGEDSGLCVDALDGHPGVRTARWAPGTDDDRSLLLLDMLKRTTVPRERRTARFVSAVAVCFPDGTEVVCRGEMTGRIAEAPRGDRADGYATIFELPGGKTIAELGASAVEPSDHRRQSLAQASKLIDEWLCRSVLMKPGTDSR